jgi:Transposase DDE domain group 1
VRRTRLVGAQATLWPDWRYHAFVTDREGGPVELDTDHSDKFLANAAWLVIATLAHNLLRWVAALGLGHHGLVAAKTLRCRLIALPGRLTRSARRWQLHLPSGWPWAGDFTQALVRLRILTTSSPALPLRIPR